MDFYISDTHFGHANIISFCDRPFGSIEEMDEAMIERWNAKVTDDDHVWHLGDFSYSNQESCRNYLQRLKGHKHLIIGNHDHRKLLKMPDVGDFFESIDYATTRTDASGKKVWMCHYPLAEPPSHIWALYGHIHNNTNAVYWDLLRNIDLALNCCVEVNGYAPVTFDELVENNMRWKSVD